MSAEDWPTLNHDATLVEKVGSGWYDWRLKDKTSKTEAKAQAKL